MITKPQTVMEYLEYFLTTQNRLSAFPSGPKPETLKTYRSRANLLKRFLDYNGLSECRPADITIQLIEEYYIFLIEAKICNNYAMKCIQFFSRIIRLALKKGDIVTSPFIHFEYHYEQPDGITYLEIEDLEKMKLAPLNEELQITLDYFLFACYTGMSFTSIKRFDYLKNTFKGPDGRRWIHIQRAKTGIHCYIPLLPETLELLKKHDFKIPLKSNQKINKGLKTIARLCGFRKRITSHVGRKTFGNILHNELNVPLETVSQMLGHTSIKTTQSWYVRTNIKKIAHDTAGITFSKRVA